MTRTVAESFSLTHAKYLASKVTSDMLRCQQNYGRPSDSEINDYGTELAILMRDDYVEKYEFGFQIDSKRILSWSYTVTSAGLGLTDDRPGRILPNVDVGKASMFNFLTPSPKWRNLSAEEKTRIRKELPIERVGGEPPADGNGYWKPDLNYVSTAGTALGRKSFVPF